MEIIPLPKSVEVLEDDGQRAVLTVGPCYPGYGVTLGNALRRVLLSSLPGAAITEVSIKGSNHEFTSLPSIKEDVVSIILNLKLVRAKLEGDEPMVISLKVKGEKQITAKDFKVPSQVKIINGDQIIATQTDKNAEFELEAVVSPGRGYIPVENREKEKRDIGRIAIDAIYTPVKTINFRTEHVRVEQMTNYDKLFLEIITDGSITPTDAFRYAANILANQFDFLRNSAGGEVVEAPVIESVVEATEPVNEPDEVIPKKKKAKEAKDE